MLLNERWTGQLSFFSTTKNKLRDITRMPKVGIVYNLKNWWASILCKAMALPPIELYSLGSIQFVPPIAN